MALLTWRAKGEIPYVKMEVFYKKELRIVYQGSILSVHL